MLENIIPVLISGVFSIISILVGKSLLTDPLQSIEAKQELLNKQPDSPQKNEKQNKLEAYALWAVEYGDIYTATRRFAFWGATSLALFVVTGSTTILGFIYQYTNTAIGINPADAYSQIEVQAHLTLDLIGFTSCLLALPLALWLATIFFTSCLREHQIKQYLTTANAIRIDKSNKKERAFASDATKKHPEESPS